MAIHGLRLWESWAACAFLGERRFQSSLLIGFSLVALLMAAIGIYGLIQYSVAMRAREIGIRMVVGAQPVARNR